MRRAVAEGERLEQLAKIQQAVMELVQVVLAERSRLVERQETQLLRAPQDPQLRVVLVLLEAKMSQVAEVAVGISAVEEALNLVTELEEEVEEVEEE